MQNTNPESQELKVPPYHPLTTLTSITGERAQGVQSWTSVKTSAHGSEAPGWLYITTCKTGPVAAHVVVFYQTTIKSGQEIENDLTFPGRGLILFWTIPRSVCNQLNKNTTNNEILHKTIPLFSSQDPLDNTVFALVYQFWNMPKLY